MKTLTLDDDVMLFVASIFGHALVGNDHRTTIVFMKLRSLFPELESFPEPEMDTSKAFPGALYLTRHHKVTAMIPSGDLANFERQFRVEFPDVTLTVEK